MVASGTDSPARKALKSLQRSIRTRYTQHAALHGFFPSYQPEYNLLPSIVCRKKWDDNLHCLTKSCMAKTLAVATRNFRSLMTGKPVKVPPRAYFACLRLFFHGWPTRSRCGVDRHECPLCLGTQDDTLDHIIRCGVVRRAFARYRVCALAHYRPEVFLLADFRHSSGTNLGMSSSCQDSSACPLSSESDSRSREWSAMGRPSRQCLQSPADCGS